MNPKQKNEEKGGDLPSNMESSTSTDKAEEQESSDESAAEEGVTVPEEYQKKVHAVVEEATTKHHLEHIRGRVYAKEDELRDAANKEKNKGKKGEEFSSVSMPDVNY